MKIYNIYFSPTYNTKKIAMYFGEQLDTIDIDLSKPSVREKYSTEENSITILSVPTYSQNIPIPLRTCLDKVISKYVIINVTYGGCSYGNLVYSLKKKLPNSKCIGYSVTPVKHTYLDRKVKIDFSKYDVLVNRIKNQVFNEIKIRFKFKNILADFLEKERTIFNYHLTWDKDLCNDCGLCIRECPMNAIDDNHNFKKNCIICARCESICPQAAIRGKMTGPIKLYFKFKKQKTSVIIR